MDPEDRVWTTAERNTLLNLIQDGGFIPGLTQEFFSNWATFERLSVLLNRCNIRVRTLVMMRMGGSHTSLYEAHLLRQLPKLTLPWKILGNLDNSKHQVEAQWQLLKEEFWKRKWMVDDGLGQASALTLDFPFYEELEQILISQKPAKVRKREADSSGLEDPSLLDSEDPVISTNLREEELEEMQNDAGPDVEEEVEVVQNDVGPHVNGEAPERGVQPSLDLQWCRHTLDAIVQNLQRLQECIQDVLRDIERVNHMFSF